MKSPLSLLLGLALIVATNASANPTPKNACTKAARNAAVAAVRASDYFKQLPATIHSVDVKKSTVKNHFTVYVDFEFQNDEDTDNDSQEETVDVTVKVDGKKCTAVATKID